jgi:hypothetical protein
MDESLMVYLLLGKRCKDEQWQKRVKTVLGKHTVVVRNVPLYT